MSYVPSFRHRCHLDGSTLVQPGHRMMVELHALPMIQHMDGHRSIREIVGKARSVAHVAENPIHSIPDEVTLEMFRAFWEKDFLAMELP